MILLVDGKPLANQFLNLSIDFKQKKMGTNNKKPYKTLGWIGLTACGICCALPIIAAVTGIAALTTLGYYLEKIGILALGIAGVLFVLYFYQKRKSKKNCSTSCETNCECKPKELPINKEH